MEKSHIIGIVLVALLFVIGADFLLQTSSREISPSDFKVQLNSTSKVAIIQDLRTLPPDDTAARLNLQNCAVQLSMVLASTGKNVSNYAFEGSDCYGGASSPPRAVDECLKEVGREQRLLFTLSFNATQNKTRLTTQGAEYFGDAQFLSECSITGLVR